MGFDIKGTVDQGLDKAKDVVNDKAGEAVNENVQKLTDKFGK